ELFSPCNSFPSHTIANASAPIPLLGASTTVSAIAVAIAASTAFPPARSIANPACPASGCDAATTFLPITALRRDPYSFPQNPSLFSCIPSTMPQLHPTQQAHLPSLLRALCDLCGLCGEFPHSFPANRR